MMKKISSDLSSDFYENSNLIRQSDLELMQAQKKIDELCSVAIKYIGIAKKSSGRIRAYLSAKGFEEELIEQAVKQLTSRGYIDDVAVAARIMRQRSGRKIVSSKACRHFMKQAGLPEPIIDSSLEQWPSDEDTVLQVLEIKYPEVDLANRDKMIRYLLGRGYSAALASKAVAMYIDKSIYDK